MAEAVAIYLGHSHTGAVFHAFDNRARRGAVAPMTHRAFNIWRSNLGLHYVVDHDGHRVLNPVVVDEIASFRTQAERTVYVSLFGGNAHNVVGLMQAHPDYDVLMPNRAVTATRTGDRPLMPLRMVESRIHAECAGFLEQITVLRQHTADRVLHLQSPPPIADSDYLKASLDDHFKQQTATPVIARRELRMDLWTLHSTMVEAHCRSVGVEFVPCPAEALTHDGFLGEPFWGNATHANGTYGELLLRQIEALVCEPGPA